MISSSITRRRFMGTSAAAAGALILPRVSDGTGETDHFWYRLAPQDGPHIDTQRGDKAFGIGDGKISLSEDNAKTWPHQADFPDAAKIEFSCILKNGNIVFATKSNIFLSTDNLKTHQALTVLDRHGKKYVPHTPKNPDRAGAYFYSLDGIHTWNVGGKEMMVWGNYCNVASEPVPVNIYYSTDSGRTIKIAYSFGRNPKFQYKGAAPDTWLGDPDTPVICRHVHSVSYNAKENAFYACTGDLERGHGLECHWLRGTYDAQADRWEWKVVASADANSRYKSGGINFVDGRVYWVADANGPKAPDEPYDRGIFTCAPEDIPNPKKHTRIFDAKYEIACMTIDDRVMLSPHYGPASPFDTGFMISLDLGKTWGEYDLKQFGQRSGVRVNPRNGDGWFRVDLRRKWLYRSEILFVKPKV